MYFFDAKHSKFHWTICQLNGTAIHICTICVHCTIFMCSTICEHLAQHTRRTVSLFVSMWSDFKRFLNRDFYKLIDGCLSWNERIKTIFIENVATQAINERTNVTIQHLSLVHFFPDSFYLLTNIAGISGTERFQLAGNTNCNTHFWCLARALQSMRCQLAIIRSIWLAHAFLSISNAHPGGICTSKSWTDLIAILCYA